MANTIGEKELKTEWPITSGLVAGTTKQEGRQENLLATDGSMVPKRTLRGIR